jgi:hypothetical protein
MFCIYKTNEHGGFGTIHDSRRSNSEKIKEEFGTDLDEWNEGNIDFSREYAPEESEFDENGDCFVMIAV